MDLSHALGHRHARLDAGKSAADSVDSKRRHGLLVQAEEECTEALRKHEDSVELLIAYGRLSLTTGDLHTAADTFERARKAAPEDERPVAWLIAVHARLHKYETWVELGEWALQHNDFRESSIIRVAFGRAYLDAHQLEKALEILQVVRYADETAAAWHLVAAAEVRGCGTVHALAEEAVKRGVGGTRLRNHQGRIYMSHERYADAVTCFEKARESDPKDPGALAGLTFAWLAMGRVDKAEHYIAIAVQLKIGTPVVLAGDACRLVEKGQYQEGAAQALAIIGLVPRNTLVVKMCLDVLRRAYQFADAERAATWTLASPGLADPWKIHAVLAAVLVDQGKYRRAVEEVGKALAYSLARAEPEIVAACIGVLRRAYQFEQATSVAEGALTGGIAHPWRIRIALAWVLSDQGQYEEAIGQANKALHDSHQHHDTCSYQWARRSRVDFLREARRFAEAEDEARQAIADEAELELPPEKREKTADYRVALAWVLSDQDREQEAAREAGLALDHDPWNLAALTARVYFLRWARDFDGAIAAAEIAGSRRPQDPDVLTARAWLSSDLGIATASDQKDKPGHKDKPGQKDKKAALEPALELVNKSLELDKSNSWALSCRVIFQSAASTYDEGEGDVTAAVGKRDGDPRVHLAAGWLRGDMDDYDPAIVEFDKALRRNGHDADALEWHAVTQRARLHLDDAVAEARASIETRRFDPGLRVELSRALDAQRKFDDALAELDTVFARDADNIAARIARSAVLRSQHLSELAEREIEDQLKRKPRNRDLETELGWIYYDQRLCTKAREKFTELRTSARNKVERAAAEYGIGWAEFRAGNFKAAEERFKAATEIRPRSANYSLALAWAITSQPEKHEQGKRRWKDAEDMARRVAKRRIDPLAEKCLGVIAFKSGRLAEAEHQFKKALELDPYDSPADLGALYVRMGRYDEALTELVKAITRDPLDLTAHLEIGYLYLQPAYEDRAAAERAFRLVLASEPTSVNALAGLAQVLALTGREIDAESLLRKALRQPDAAQPWRTRRELAKLLVQAGNEEQGADQLGEACLQAEKAVHEAKKHSDVSDEDQAELQFVAGVARSYLAAVTPGPVHRGLGQLRAQTHIRHCLRLDPDHVEALRYRGVLRRAAVSTRVSLAATFLTAGVTLGLLGYEWGLFIASDGTQISSTLICADTPVLIGLLMISFLLPVLVHLKMPGFEAEIQPNRGNTAPGPDGIDAFGPGRFTVSPGPLGEIPRRGADSPKYYHPPQH